MSDPNAADPLAPDMPVPEVPALDVPAPAMAAPELPNAEIQQAQTGLPQIPAPADLAGIDARLDEALDESFPASDPPAMTEPAFEPPAPPPTSLSSPAPSDRPEEAARPADRSAPEAHAPPAPAPRLHAMQNRIPLPLDAATATQGYEAMGLVTQDILRTWSECASQTGLFLSQRFQKDCELFSTLARCDGPIDAGECWSRFFGEAAADYSKQAQAMGDTMTRHLQKTVEDMQGLTGKAKAPTLE